MRHYLKTTGFVAVGLLGLQAAHGQSKPWSVSASVRGFYDDNYATAPSTPPPGTAGKQNSFGVEFSPGASLTVKRGQTDLLLEYLYTVKYYEDRANSADHSHQFDARLDQKFGAERYRASVRDSFVVAQESALIDPALAATPLRSNGDNLRNTAELSLQADLTGPLALELGYVNNFYDYQETGPASRSALLDRMEHLARANARWEIQRNSIALLGYQFGVMDQTSKDFVDAAATIPANVRDNHSHYVYLGIDHYFTDRLSVHPRAGVQYTEFPNALPPARDNTFGPYADVSASYTYAENSSLQLGARHSRTQTDVAVVGPGGATLDAETTAVYASIKHGITAKLKAGALVQFQSSEFNQGAAGNQRDNYFIAGLNLGYDINEFLTAEAGYNLDRLSSDLASRSFTRNRVYIGIRAKY